MNQRKSDRHQTEKFMEYKKFSNWNEFMKWFFLRKKHYWIFSWFATLLVFGSCIVVFSHSFVSFFCGQCHGSARVCIILVAKAIISLARKFTLNDLICFIFIRFAYAFIVCTVLFPVWKSHKKYPRFMWFYLLSIVRWRKSARMEKTMKNTKYENNGNWIDEIDVEKVILCWCKLLHAYKYDAIKLKCEAKWIFTSCDVQLLSGILHAW